MLFGPPVFVTMLVLDDSYLKLKGLMCVAIMIRSLFYKILCLRVSWTLLIFFSHFYPANIKHAYKIINSLKKQITARFFIKKGFTDQKW